MYCSQSVPRRPFNWPTFINPELFQHFYARHLEPITQDWSNKIIKMNPRWVGFTSFSHSDSYTIEALCKILREKNPNIKIVIGGPNAHNLQEHLCKKKLIDAYILGPGEEALIQLLKGNLSYPGINSLSSTAGKISDLPIPDYSDFDLSKYPANYLDPNPNHLGMKKHWVMNSQGCTKNCSFCEVSKIKRKYRFRSFKNVVAEIIELNKKHNISTFTFSDSMINGDLNSLRGLCEELIRAQEQHGIKLFWNAHFSVRPHKQMSPNDFELMAKSGCVCLKVGVESGSPAVRKSMNKPFSDQDINFLMTQAFTYKIKILILLIVGYPTETEEDFQASINLLKRFERLGVHSAIDKIFLVPCVIIPGTPLDKIAKKLGVENNDSFTWTYQDNTFSKRIERCSQISKLAQKFGIPVSGGTKLAWVNNYIMSSPSLPTPTKYSEKKSF